MCAVNCLGHTPFFKSFHGDEFWGWDLASDALVLVLAQRLQIRHLPVDHPLPDRLLEEGSYLRLIDLYLRLVFKAHKLVFKAHRSLYSRLESARSRSGAATAGRSIIRCRIACSVQFAI